MSAPPRVIIMALVLAPLAVRATAERLPESAREVGRRLTETLLAREHMRYPERGLHYAEAGAAVGGRYLGDFHSQVPLLWLVREWMAAPGAGEPL